MLMESILLAGAAFVFSLLLTAGMRAVALRRGMLDVPNERSSHTVPTPRGGGVAIVLATTSALMALYAMDAMPASLFLALSVGGVVIAGVGFMDDRRRLSPGLRLMVHFTGAAWALACLGGVPPVSFGGQLVALGWTGHVIGTLAIVWTLNLFNFMDGIDGIAGSEAMFISWSGAGFALLANVAPAVPTVALIFGAACCGFLFWNWPPARIFMGDAGSGYLGYLIAVLSIAAMRESPTAIYIWLVLGGVFFVDATVTLLRRLRRGERIYEAHRSHAYQILARRWQSHRRVTLAVLMLNFIWLLPCAALIVLRPRYAIYITLAALLPLALITVVLGRGNGERFGPPSE